ncbi:MAG: hypothetical protein WDW38_010718 [Sanguina aurantia]
MWTAHWVRAVMQQPSCNIMRGDQPAVLLLTQELRSLVGIDTDPVAHAIAGARLSALQQQLQRPDLSTHLLRGNYSDVSQLLSGVPGTPLVGQVDGMLMDLGVSSMQIDSAERGFSFMREGPIDMRMNPDGDLSAEEVLNNWSEAELGRIIRDYGEEKMWRSVASRPTSAAGRRGGKHIHPATRTFQALRIAVNDELQRLEKALPEAINSLAPGGRLLVISFHSLEDRVVKHTFMRAAGKTTPDEEHMTHGASKYDYADQLEQRVVIKSITRKPAVATESEILSNPRSRSAKLRVVEKL